MAIFKTIEVPLQTRAFLVVDQVPTRFLRPGSTRVWALGKTIEVVRFQTSELVVALAPELRALVPDGELVRVELGRHEAAIVSRNKVPSRLLREGRWDLWAHADLEVERLDLSGIACEPVRDARRALLDRSCYVEVLVPEGAAGLRLVDGQLDAVLPPGRHAAWTALREVTLMAIDLRERIVSISNQEVMSRDKVSLRLNASITIKVADAARLARTAKDADAALYLSAQLALRDAVATHTLDELLSQRSLLTDAIMPTLIARADALGLAVVDVGVKDLILPGEMRTLLNRVIEAQKDAEANVIARREETAATRSMAQTAKVLSENPLLMRLKELETYKDLATKVGTLHVVLGDSALGKLEMKA